MTVRRVVKLLKDYQCSVWEQCNGYEVLLYLSGDDNKELKKIGRRKVVSITFNNNMYMIMVR